MEKEKVGYYVSIVVNPVKDSGKLYVKRLSELPESVLPAAEQISRDPNVELVAIESGMLRLIELTPKDDDALARIIEKRDAPELSAMVRTDPRIAAELRRVMRLPTFDSE